MTLTAEMADFRPRCRSRLPVELKRAATKLMAAAREVPSSRINSPATEVRAAAQVLARLTATHLDNFWSQSETTGDAPFDVIDMFSGCGGMSAGFRAVNGVLPCYRIAAAVDIDKVANRTYAANFGIEPAHMDIARVARGRKLLNTIESSRRPDSPLVLIGCAPCQGFSSHRNKAGESDERNSLFDDFARIAVRLRPAAIVVENVPEILTERYWPYVQQARKRLEKAGYYVHLTVHNMAEFGVAQERFRALMIAMPKPFSPPKGFLSRGDFRTVRQAIGTMPPVAPGARHPDDEMHYSAGHKHSTIETIRAVPKNGGSRPSDVGPECLRRAGKKNGRAVYEDVYGRLFWDRPAITITAYARNPASGRFVHPEQDRGLTVREAALLQGFPVDYWFSGSLDERFRQIGNAVPPAFASALAAHILGELLLPQGTECAYDPGLTQPVGPSFSRLIPALKAGHRQEVLSRAAAQA